MKFTKRVSIVIVVLLVGASSIYMISRNGSQPNVEVITQNPTNTADTNVTQSTDTSVENNDLEIATPKYDCGADYLKPIEVKGEIYCTLDVPYFNQVLNSEGKKVQDPSKKADVAYMCTAASSVMIMGYYNALEYANTDELREHLYKPLSSPALKSGNTVTVNGTRIKLCMDGAFALTSYNPATGRSMCNWNNNVNVYFNYLGYKIANVTPDFNSVVKELKKGRPILFNIAPYDEIAGGILESHYVVIKGYSTSAGSQILLLNDPDRDLNNKFNNKCAGLSRPANLDGQNSVFNFKSHPCSRINSMFSVYK